MSVSHDEFATAPEGARHLPVIGGGGSQPVASGHDAHVAHAGDTAHTVHTVHEADLDAMAAVSTVLSRWLMSPPDAATLAAVCEPAMLAEWPLAPEGETAAGLRELARHREEGETADDVAADHMRLFVGPGHVPISPYESVHRSVEGLLFDEQTLQVRRWYHRFGLTAPREGREPDDHIALELEFVATLLGSAVDAVDAGENDDASLFAQSTAEFTAEHLGTWAPAWFGLVLAQARTPFYRGVAHLGLGLLEKLRLDLPG